MKLQDLKNTQGKSFLNEASINPDVYYHTTEVASAETIKKEGLLIKKEYSNVSRWGDNEKYYLNYYGGIKPIFLSFKPYGYKYSLEMGLIEVSNLSDKYIDIDLPTFIDSIFGEVNSKGISLREYCIDNDYHNRKLDYNFIEFINALHGSKVTHGDLYTWNLPYDEIDERKKQLIINLTKTIAYKKNIPPSSIGKIKKVVFAGLGHIDKGTID